MVTRGDLEEHRDVRLGQALPWFDEACRRAWRRDGMTNRDVAREINVDHPATVSRYRTRASAPTQAFIKTRLINFVWRYVEPEELQSPPGV